MYFAPLAFALALSLPQEPAQNPAPKTYELRWQLAAGQVIEASLADHREDASSMQITVGGQEPQPQEHSSKHEFELVWRDEVQAVKDGLPMHVKRKFTELVHSI